MTVGRRRRGHPGCFGVAGPPAPPGPPEVPVNAVNFDGTNDYLTRGAGLTGAADGKQITVSVWVKFGNDTGNPAIFSSELSISGIRLERETSPRTIKLTTAQPTTGVGIWIASSTTTVSVADGWTHLLMSLNSATGVRAMYINDVLETLSAETFNSDTTIDMTLTNWAVGASTNGDQKLNGDVSELWLDDNALDLSVEANRRKFISAGGKPVDLGANGEDPLGAAPLVYFSGPTVTWHTNKGTGGGFTENGAITDASSSPSD